MSDRDRLVELLNEAEREYCDYLALFSEDGYKTPEKSGAEFYADYILADGWTRLPCKMGDRVYRLNDVVLYGECKHCGHCLVLDYSDPCECERTGQPRKHPDCIQIVEKQIDYKEILLCLAHGDFGKTVFLTREEAEQALKERKEK